MHAMEMLLARPNVPFGRSGGYQLSYQPERTFVLAGRPKISRKYLVKSEIQIPIYYLHKILVIASIYL